MNSLNNIDTIILSEAGIMDQVGPGKLYLTSRRLYFKRQIRLLSDEHSETVYDSLIEDLLDANSLMPSKILSFLCLSRRERLLIVRNNVKVFDSSRDVIRKVVFRSLKNPILWSKIINNTMIASKIQEGFTY